MPPLNLTTNKYSEKKENLICPIYAYVIIVKRIYYTNEFGMNTPNLVKPFVP